MKRVELRCDRRDVEYPLNAPTWIAADPSSSSRRCFSVILIDRYAARRYGLSPMSNRDEAIRSWLVSDWMRNRYGNELLDEIQNSNVDGVAAFWVAEFVQRPMPYGAAVVAGAMRSFLRDEESFSDAEYVELDKGAEGRAACDAVAGLLSAKLWEMGYGQWDLVEGSMVRVPAWGWLSEHMPERLGNG